ncbi:chloramphenicol phosphotransferase CPT family protein [Flexivirga caeni]|uniref:chloramphenicol phosphotransferase CPT family protein n=1 Tax=Flexivirga caeni TaxID=2294115 RepID=UPI001C654A17
MSARPGRVVLLNGPSSAGKSSLAAAFAAIQPTPWHNLPVDLVHSSRSRPAEMSHLPGTRHRGWTPSGAAAPDTTGCSPLWREPETTWLAITC